MQPPSHPRTTIRQDRRVRLLPPPPQPARGLCPKATFISLVVHPMPNPSLDTSTLHWVSWGISLSILKDPQPKHGIQNSVTVSPDPFLVCHGSDKSADKLYDFIRYRSRMRPGFKMQCTGSHWEHHQHNHTVFENGVSVDKRKGQSDRIVDFDFYVCPHSSILVLMLTSRLTCRIS